MELFFSAWTILTTALGMWWIYFNRRHFQIFLGKISTLYSIYGHLSSTFPNAKVEPHHHTPQLHIHPSGKSALLAYERNGHRYVIHFPYDKRLCHKMTNSRVEILYADLHSDILNQQPGIPYLITPSQLGAIKAMVYHEDGSVKEYHADQLICV